MLVVPFIGCNKGNYAEEATECEDAPAAGCEITLCCRVTNSYIDYELVEQFANACWLQEGPYNPFMESVAESNGWACEVHGDGSQPDDIDCDDATETFVDDNC